MTAQSPPTPQRAEATPEERLERAKDTWLTEARDLRKQLQDRVPSSSNAGPQAWLDTLVYARAVADHIEEAYVSAEMLLAGCRRATKDARDAQQDAWDRLAHDQASGRGAEFVAPRERYADHNVATLDEQRELRRRQRIESQAEELADALRDLLRGVNNTRSDCATILRTYQFLSSLEQ